MVKNLLCSAGNTGSNPGRESKIPPAVEQLSLRATIRGACVPQQKIPYDATKVPWAATKTQHSQINNFFFKY